MTELPPRDKIRFIGQELAIGATDNRTLCVYCDGGTSHERSFAITRQDRYTVAYKCHRASCGREGYVHLSSGAGEEVQKTKVFTPNPYKGTTVALEYDDLAYLDETYDLDLEYVIKAGWARADEPGFSLALPVISPIGTLRGLIVRRKLEDGRKYVHSYKIVDEPWLCWYRTSFRDVVVVEDQISALKVAKYATSVALLGTHLSQEKIDEIRNVAKTGKIWLALDKDASNRTFEYLKQYRLYCNGNLNGLMLSKDIKDMSYPEIRKLEPFSNVLS
jgi:hypothetical protein